ncbi:G-type lectin S-receptor-like serine/threonine-protein kinase SD2-5 [Sorghum bicolor]|uniref:non-specific serine/threonine protein kinase n=1 Tax=Sorghum bicolor TaxID=4558 RepID=C5XNQ8_SORBI|nr:G-type lectin S-receptor-like serine/threonine-protein kinase SD2-5 [Sorghum bicolor]XP_021312486.1 G-type lectin S-receptor-like serine/threonine-protein kinase SD2-5 [Sorghum bicolor]XP_021312487.1 G-type lectin S-receptor-like serine/threonine-protein kinase SD2-5 [Sorghum bicolor]EES03148.1 hypothetical protein SORBI_3003G193200 [Sorghum bicolor]|eukprot:XP_002458028.1 G-type lectin S-receptor-like serine/threonine-protein kinase SD2-5 [Sorghum bicolor]
MGVAVKASIALHLLPILLLTATNDAATFTITNNCSFTVWPAATPVGGGTQLNPGQTWTLNVPAGTSAGRLWGRTGCSFRGGSGRCQTGNCGGVLSCKLSPQPPVTLAEFTVNSGTSDFFDISVIDGFNLPMDFMGGAGCSKGPRCLGNSTSQCSDAYTNPSDDNKTFTCPAGTDYQLVFCPSVDLRPTPVTVSPQPAPSPATVIQIAPPSPSLVLSPRGATTARSSSANQVVVILATVGGFIFLVILFIAIFFMCKRRTRHQEMEEMEEFEDLQGTPMRFTFRQLKVATEDFRDKLGEGGFGTVYRGQFGEDIIAVKHLDRTGQGKREFLAEVQTIGGIHHINLVRLIGFCAERSHRLLVYEFMPKGSLDKWIYNRQGNNTTLLDWRTRCKIITHIAKGLCYLHEECTKRIAHLDVKPQNILLDDSFNAKLSDFGLCKLIDRDTSQVITRMRGTPGYLAPEWLTSQITEKADIYSFGIVVMEIISGRKNLDTSRSEESTHLITLLEERVKNGQLAELIDKHNNDMQVHKQEVIQVMKLAMWCLQIDCKRRPQMSDVVKVMDGTMDVETNIDHNFVARSRTIFGVAGNAASSSPYLASDVSGPR